MSGSDLTLLIAVAVLISTGVFLLLERSLTRIILGILLASNGVNLLIIAAGGAAGEPPLLGRAPVGRMNDPLPQVVILTAIVITLALVAFLLSLAHRSREVTGDDEVRDDEEDRRVIARAAREEARLRILEERAQARRVTAEEGYRAGVRARRGVRSSIRRERRELRRRLREEWERQVAADDPDSAIDTTMGKDVQ
ncbi:Na(+)/H(+) antiporter subunit C [Thermostaphylospora chromogena]|uniref:Multisubunit sodium/proton antiporter, MrpC subunit n=1 Tax=Thermostaphylospora chromogena TaxID=35622 RepID=A0A1H1CBZ2_9ACTN|nr:Na(+)/H(+) antiporter subunit C [Thermostaphylospora chromogena]SDQ61704.1 multisubunit sodium/proton antiporter, MrpC subunit [Thermostaphylospora chromogena]